MDFGDLNMEPEERNRLMDKLRSGRRLTQVEAESVARMLLQIIKEDEKNRSDATLFLAALSGRYGIEIKTD